MTDCGHDVRRKSQVLFLLPEARCFGKGFPPSSKESSFFKNCPGCLPLAFRAAPPASPNFRPRARPLTPQLQAAHFPCSTSCSRLCGVWGALGTSGSPKRVGLPQPWPSLYWVLWVLPLPIRPGERTFLVGRDGPLMATHGLKPFVIIDAGT